MKALTLWQPWAWAVASGRKRVENRPWAAPASAIKTTIAIHAGKVYDKDGEVFLERHRVEMPADGAHRIHGAIIGTARIERILRKDEGGVLFPYDDPKDPVREDPMFFGPWGWVLSDVTHLATPIYCAGSLGLWRVPEDVLALMRSAA